MWILRTSQVSYHFQFSSSLSLEFHTFCRVKKNNSILLWTRNKIVIEIVEYWQCAIYNSFIALNIFFSCFHLKTQRSIFRTQTHNECDSVQTQTFELLSQNWFPIETNMWQCNEITQALLLLLLLFVFFPHFQLTNWEKKCVYNLAFFRFVHSMIFLIFVYLRSHVISDSTRKQTKLMFNVHSKLVSRF